MKIIWQGTDSLFLVKFPKQLKWTKIFYVMALRVFAKLTDIFAQEHYACGELVDNNIHKFGMRKKVIRFKDLLLYPAKIQKKQHEGFNVLYYFPKKDTCFNRWLYGYDIYLGLLIELIVPNIHFIVVDGTKDMNAIYPLVDVLIRPNRHDGHPRMIDECILNGIPYIYTKQNPTLEYFKNQILEEYESK